MSVPAPDVRALEPGVRVVVQQMMEVIGGLADPSAPAADGQMLLTWAVALDQATGRPRYHLERSAPDAEGNTTLQVLDRGEQPSLIVTPGRA